MDQKTHFGIVKVEDEYMGVKFRCGPVDGLDEKRNIEEIVKGGGQFFPQVFEPEKKQKVECSGFSIEDMNGTIHSNAHEALGKEMYFKVLELMDRSGEKEFLMMLYGLTIIKKRGGIDLSIKKEDEKRN